MKAIVYTSHAGHTEMYARLMAKETGLHAYELKAAEKVLPEGTEVLYFGWLMGGTVAGYKDAAKKFRIAALTGVGMARPGTQVADILQKNAVPEGTPVFSLQGGFEMEKVHGFYKLMMRVMRAAVGKNLEKKTDKTEEDEEMLKMMKEGVNTVSLKNLAPVLDWYRGELQDAC